MAQLSPLLHFSFCLQQGRTSFSSTVSFSLMYILPNTGQPTKYIQSCCPKGVWDQIAYWERAVVCSVPGRLGPIPSRVLGLSRSKLFSEGVLAVRYFWFLHSAVWAYVMAVLATSIGMTSFFSPTASRSLHVITYRTTISSCLVCPLIQPYLPQVLCLITALYCFVPALCFLQLYTILPLP